VANAREQDLADRITTAYHRVWADLAIGVGAVQDDGDVLMVSTRSPIAPFNRAFVVSDPDDPERSVARARRFYADLPFFFETRDGLHPKAVAAAQAAGWPESGSSPGMAMDPIDVTALLSGSPGLVVEEAKTPAAVEANLIVQADGFGVPIEFMQTVFTTGLAAENVRCFTGSVDGKPVATSIVILGDQLAGVYSVATVGDVRRRGYGEAMTAHAVRVGAQENNCLIAYLQASEMGRPIYERMGFRELTTYRTYLGAPG